jgi:hypothetical protein
MNRHALYGGFSGAHTENPPWVAGNSADPIVKRSCTKLRNFGFRVACRESRQYRDGMSCKSGINQPRQQGDVTMRP